MNANSIVSPLHSAIAEADHCIGIAARAKNERLRLIEALEADARAWRECAPFKSRANDLVGVSQNGKNLIEGLCDEIDMLLKRQEEDRKFAAGCIELLERARFFLSRREGVSDTDQDIVIAITGFLDVPF